MKTLAIRLQSLAIFRALLDDPVVWALRSFLEQTDTAKAVSAYGNFVAALYRTEKRTLAGYIESIVWHDENAYIRMIGMGAEPWPEMEADVWAELEVLQAVADLTPETLRTGVDWEGYLPGFGTKQVDLAQSYRQRCDNIGQFGYGIYAKYHMFYVNPENKIVPVRNANSTATTPSKPRRTAPTIIS